MLIVLFIRSIYVVAIFGLLLEIMLSGMVAVLLFVCGFGGYLCLIFSCVVGGWSWWLV